MKHRVFFLAPFSCSLLLGSPASAQSVDTDVRCLLLSQLFINASKDPKAKRVAEAGLLFYLGRIDGRISDGQLKTALQAQQKGINTANAGVLMAGCARHMEASARSIQSLSRQLVPKK